MITGFLPVFCTLLIGKILIRKRPKKVSMPAPIRIASSLSLAGCLLNSFVFLNWTGEHNFAVLPYIITLSIIAGWIFTHLNHRQAIMLGITHLALALGQYYYINFPGQATAKGFRYDSYREAGKVIQQIASPDERIFCNEDYIIYQYYAKRTFTVVGSYEDALQWAKKYNVKKGVWIRVMETRETVVIQEVRHFEQ